MANPRKRKAIKDGRMEKMLQEKESSVLTKKEEKLLIEMPVAQEQIEKGEEKSIDPFIAKELKEIERIPSNKIKRTKKKTGAKRKQVPSE
mgnify:FL=1